MKRNNRQWLISIHNNATSLIRKWIYMLLYISMTRTEDYVDLLTVISIFKYYI